MVLLGASGCGKSTLLRVLADLDREITGVVRGRDSAGGVLPVAAADALEEGLAERRSRAARPAGPGQRAEAALAEVGMSHRSDVWPKVLSGGEAQRASLARALVREPDLLLLDEPFSALDALTRLTAQALVADLWALHQCAVLLVTHDVEESVRLADRVLVMDGRGHRARGPGRPAAPAGRHRSRVRATAGRTARPLGVGDALMIGPCRRTPIPAPTSVALGHADARQWGCWPACGRADSRRDQL